MSADAAGAKIAALASLMHAKKKLGKPFTVLLGAGASISSGVIPTVRLMREIVDQYGPDIEGTDYAERFNELWVRSSEQNRDIYLKPYLDRRPSPGYAHLAELIKQGFIDRVITFNFDNLVEAALVDAGFRETFDYKVIVRGDHKDERVVSMMSAPDPRIKILKLHGSLRGGNTFLFSQDEMSDYPEQINELVQRLTSSDIIVCGYGFADLCVIRAFSNTGESIFCVDPSGAPPMLKGFLVRRGSNKNVLDGENGKFDNFFESLRGAVLKPQVAAPAKPALNPFKFFDSYEPCDKQWLFGRRALTRKLIQKVPSGAVPGAGMIPVIGPAKVGKTSFVRAGFLPYLDPARFCPVYVRCTKDLEQSLPQALSERYNCPVPAGDLPSTLRALALWKPDRRIVLVLDQFERVVAKFQGSPRELNEFVESLRDACADNLTLVPVGEMDSRSRMILCLNALKIEYLYVPAIEPRAVGRIVRMLAKKAGAGFDPAVPETLRKRYEESMLDERKPPFTLAHVQAICNLMVEDALAGQSTLDEAGLSETLKQHLDSLNRAINQFDILSFVEDFPLEEQRALLCRILRIVAEPGRTRIADYLRANLAELLRVRPSQAAGAAGGV